MKGKFVFIGFLGIAGLLLAVSDGAAQQLSSTSTKMSSSKTIRTSTADCPRPGTDFSIIGKLPGVTAQRPALQSTNKQRPLAKHSYGAFWEMGEGYSTTLIVRNKDEHNPVAGDLLLFSNDGALIKRHPITIGISSVSRYKLGEILQPAHDARLWGSLSLEFNDP